ncbi:hypothetical protein [Riemerella columbipharyngis]|uniref:Uncharacterized protein n=1 Tax=Riemerella columbipharyngis TaxID=1071918 RepID=A0A1G7FDH6_9FLAO|nr:hypothetical protein [Riemerella columbipharyngis]SDE74001.1 hypothetical protein SAMN05421544_1224 [Riemerella columbipharyngis]
MKKFIHRIICIKTSRVIRIWSEPHNSIAIRSLYFFGIRVKDMDSRVVTRKEQLRAFNYF